MMYVETLEDSCINSYSYACWQVMQCACGLSSMHAVMFLPTTDATATVVKHAMLV